MKTDFLIVGAGVIGLTVALEIKKRWPSSSVVVLEKEKALAAHGSGRNSGVLHAGFYYTADSMKARFTKEGNRLLTSYCEEKKLKINHCGKLVVANTEEEQKGLDELFRRGKINGVEIEEISEKEALKIEPHVRTEGRALFSPTTKSIDPVEVMHALEKDARKVGIEIRFASPFCKKRCDAGYVINAAGLYADQVAHAFLAGQNYRILPFKGLYLYAAIPTPLKTNIYPVPNLKNPFLGVHFTVTAAGAAKIGPTAIPCFWREQYAALTNFKLNEFCDLAWRQLGLLAKKEYRQLAQEEIRKQNRHRLAHLSQALVRNLDTSVFSKRGKPGIRAQLFNIKEKKLEMDFVIEKKERSLHILNAVSPALTCSFAFASHVVDQIDHM